MRNIQRFGCLLSRGSLGPSTCNGLLRYSGRLQFGAVYGDPLGHHSDRPDQANREHDGDSDACAHLSSPLRDAELAAFPGIGSTRYSCRRVSVHAEKLRTPSLGEPSTQPKGRGFVFPSEGCWPLSSQPIASVLKKVFPQLLAIADPAIRIREPRFLAIYERERLQRGAWPHDCRCFSRSSPAHF